MPKKKPKAKKLGKGKKTEEEAPDAELDPLGLGSGNEDDDDEPDLAGLERLLDLQPKKRPSARGSGGSQKKPASSKSKAQTGNKEDHCVACLRQR